MGNVILDIVFVLVMEMGSMGAALATVVSQAFSFISCAIYLFRNKEKYGLTLSRSELTGIDRGMLGSLIKLGLPMAATRISARRVCAARSTVRL